jgi:5-methylthioadenosine/S-adenosylhomocysteine deaminase
MKSDPSAHVTDNTADLLITGAEWVITMDPDRRLIRDGAVAIVKDRILAVGKTADLKARYGSARTLDAKYKVVLPALINTHLHHTQQLARGMADECEIERWLVERIYPYEAAMTREEARISALAGHLDMIKNGVSTYIDPGGYYPDETAEVTGETGLRGIITRSTLDIHSSTFGAIPKSLTSEDTQQALKEGEEIVKRWHNGFDGRLRAWFGLRSMRNCSDNLCRGVKELADQYGVGVEAHVLGSHPNIWASISRFGRTDVERLHQLGVLGPNWLMVHMGWVSPHEVHLLREFDVKISQCPAASMHGSSGRSYHGSFTEMHQLGVCVSIGTDSSPEGNFGDIVRNMYLASCTAKDQQLDAQLMPASTVLEMDLRNGARAALWDDEIGSLEEEKKADIVLFDVQRPEWQPLYDPVSTLVYSATGASADTLVVNGRIIMEGRRVLTMDEEAVLKESQRVAESLVRRAGLERLSAPRWPVC